MKWCMSCSRCDSSRGQLTPTNRTRENTGHPQCECYRDGKEESSVFNTLGHETFLGHIGVERIAGRDELEITLSMADTVRQHTVLL